MHAPTIKTALSTKRAEGCGRRWTMHSSNGGPWSPGRRKMPTRCREIHHRRVQRRGERRYVNGVSRWLIIGKMKMITRYFCRLHNNVGISRVNIIFSDIDRDVVSIAISYMDRFLSHHTSIPETLFQLVAMTSLYLAVKQHSTRKINVQSMVSCQWCMRRTHAERSSYAETHQLFMHSRL